MVKFQPFQYLVKQIYYIYGISWSCNVQRQGEYVPEPDILFKDTMASSHGKWAWSLDLEIRTEATGEDYREHVEE